MKTLLGLIGYPLSHSFSKEYFRGKFDQEGISGYEYELFPLEHIAGLPELLRENPRLAGLNVTIPHKVAVLPYLQHLDETAAAIGAVNTIKISRHADSQGNSADSGLQAGGGFRGSQASSEFPGLPENLVLSGYNTDAWGFSASLRPLLQPWHKKALILGTGGASKAVLYVLRSLGIDPVYVSRKPAKERSGGKGRPDAKAGTTNKPGAEPEARQGGDQEVEPEAEQISYRQLDAGMIREHPVIINTTPLGTFPDTENCPDIPYEALSERNLLYDLVYNPAETLFLKKGKEKGAITMNGMEMLRLQAEKAWEIWTKEA